MYDLLFQYFNSKTGIDQEDFNSIAPFFSLKKIKRNEFLLFEGDVCDYNYFVNMGCLRFYTINEDGHENMRYFAFEKKFGTALSSFISGIPSFEYIQAIEKTEVLTIPKSDFKKLISSNKLVNLVYRDMLEMAYTTSQERIYGLQGQSALQRLRWLLEYQPNIFRRLSSKVIASYLVVTPYTLSRLKSEL